LQESWREIKYQRSSEQRFMTILDDKRKLWKMHHAAADFSMVAETCSYILKNDVKADPIYYALVVGIYTVYGRPFTQSIGAGKLDDSIVPKEHRALHQQLLKHRHQVYAHSDATGAPAAFGNINQVRFFVRSKDILPGVIRWRSDPAVLKEIVVLCQALKKKTKYWIDKIQDKHFPHLNVPIGQYVIDLDATSQKFLMAIPSLPH
jgi:hypothetical protein